MFGYCLLESSPFQVKDQNVVDMEETVGEEEMAEMEGGETLIKIYCMRKLKIHKNQNYECMDGYS